jgi:thioredoxin reductase
VYDLIIVGGGPAGLTATVYAINKRLETLLVAENIGGKANYRMRLRGMEGFEHITGEEVVRKFKGQVEYLDYACRIDEAVRIEPVTGPGGGQRFEVSTAGGQVLVSRAVILATGARPRLLGIPGEREFLGRGLSYSAVSHAPLFWGRDAAVVGGGRLAFRAAAELATLANQVYLVSPQALPSGLALADKVAKMENVSVLSGYELESVAGAEYLTEATVRDTAGSSKVLPVQGVFVEIGLEPNSDLVQGIADLDENGYVVVDSRGATSLSGLFGAGDVTNTYAEQVLIAVGDGAKAALAAHEFLLEHPKHLADPPPLV